MAECTGAARLMFMGVSVPENSLVVRDAIGDSDNDTLMCVTDFTPCCSTDIISGWYWGFQDELIPTSNNDITMSRGDQVVRLHRPGNPGAEGIFRCTIQVAANTFQELYVGVYGDELNNNGEYIPSLSKYHLGHVCWNTWQS